MKYLNRMTSWIIKNISLLVSVLLLTMTIAVFGPIELYFTNCEEFWFGGKDIGLVTIILASCCFIVFVVIGFLLRERTREIYSGFIFAFGIDIVNR